MLTQSSLNINCCNSCLIWRPQMIITEKKIWKESRQVHRELQGILPSFSVTLTATKRCFVTIHIIRAFTLIPLNYENPNKWWKCQGNPWWCHIYRAFFRCPLILVLGECTERDRKCGCGFISHSGAQKVRTWPFRVKVIPWSFITQYLNYGFKVREREEIISSLHVGHFMKRV